MVKVTLDGTSIDHLVLDEDITVRVGRTDILHRGEPGAASLILYLDQWVDVGYKSLIEITEGNGGAGYGSGPYGAGPYGTGDSGGLRFSGRVTDTPTTWWEEHPDDPDRFMLGMRLQCVGPLGGWGRRRVGDEPWPAEPVADRAARIATLVGQPLIVQGGAPYVIARDVDSQPAIDLLEELAVDCSGWLFDHAGNTYLQSLEVRRIYDPQERWDDQATTWNGWEGTWDQQTGTAGTAAVTIRPNPDAVLFAPPLEVTSDLANHVRVYYGTEDEVTSEQPYIEFEDAGSLALYGPEDVRITTRLEDLAEAQLRAQLTLERGAWPQWHLPRVELDWAALDPAVAVQLSAALPGTMVEVTHLPEPGPFQTFTGCIEGWTDQWSWDDAAGAVLRTTTLHLSDTRWSFAVLTWDGFVPDTLTWDAIDCTWDQMLTAEDLEAAA